MTPKFYDITQSSEEWHLLRCGKFTASNFADLFMGKSTGRYQKAIYRVVYGRIANKPIDDFKSGYMSRGLEIEPEAISYYEGLTFDKVNNGGLFELDEWQSCSPDGCVGEDGLLQIKSPAWNTMIDYLYTGKIPSDYKIQVQGELMCSGKNWCDLLFYHPELGHVINRIYANEEEQENIKKEIRIAILKAKEILKKLGH